MTLLDELGMGELRSIEESTRVTYEDPGQAGRKRRLLKMLGGHEAGGNPAAGVVAVTLRFAVGNDAGRTRRTKCVKVAGFQGESGRVVGR